MRVRLVAGFLLPFLLACEKEPAPAPAPKARAAPTPSAPQAAERVEPERAPGDPVRGKALVAQFECNRCHDGTGHEPMADEKHCAHCHDNILAGKVRAPAAILTRWRQKVAGLRDVPSLEAAGARFEPEWLERFLLEPRDLRPSLASTMPRLALTEAQARDIVAHLTSDRKEGGAPLEGGDVAAGRRLFEEKSCGRCHAFAPAETEWKPNAANPSSEDGRAIALAPDLRFTRERFRRDQLVRWLMNPAEVKPGTRMPAHGLTPQEARHVAQFLLGALLGPGRQHAVPELPPPLTRPVAFAEVKERVLGVTCGHCHGNPDAALGDGGPGNTGGFGFSPKRLDLTTYSGVAAGYVDGHGERHSVFAPTSSGVPRIVAALLARHAEEAGRPNPEVRGMPLGLPPLPVEDIQLVATWVEQGRPR